MAAPTSSRTNSDRRGDQSEEPRKVNEELVEWLAGRLSQLQLCKPTNYAAGPLQQLGKRIEDPRVI